MNFITRLFTSKIIKEANGRIIYFDPISKNGYKLTGKLAKQHNLLPMRFAVAAFAYLVLYSVFPVVLGYSTEIIFGVITLFGLIGFEIYFNNILLPKLSCYPNYKEPTTKQVKHSRNKNILLFVSYLLIVVLLVLFCIEKPAISSYIVAIVLGLASLLRCINIAKELKKDKNSLEF